MIVTLPPTSIVSQSGLLGDVSAINDDPASPRTDWLTRTGGEYQAGVLYRLTPSGPGYETEAETIAAIAIEAAKPINAVSGRPLPLVGHWHRTNLPLSWQRAKIAAGVPLLPWVSWDGVTQPDADIEWLSDNSLPFVAIYGNQWQPPLYSTAWSQWKVRWQATPKRVAVAAAITNVEAVGSTSVIVTVGTVGVIKTYGWLRGLTGDWAALNDDYRDITILSDTTFSIAADASSFATYSGNGGELVNGIGLYNGFAQTSEGWAAAGSYWTNTPNWARMQSLYPNPPRVFFVHNNETGADDGVSDAPLDVRYVEANPTDTSYVRAKAVCDGYAQCWNWFFDGMRSNLSSAWSAAASFGAYNAFGDRRYGYVASTTRAADTAVFNKHTWAWFAYDQVSIEFYDEANYWRTNYPNACSAPWMTYGYGHHMAAMVSRFQADIAQSVNADYWPEILVWDDRRWADTTVAQSIESITPIGSASITVRTANQHGLTGTLVRNFSSMTGDWAGLNSNVYTATVLDEYEMTFPIDGSWRAAYVGGGLVHSASKPGHYKAKGINYTPGYYKGWVQWCVWCMQPRALREYRGSTELVDEEPLLSYFEAVLDVVRHVHQHPELRRFWQHGVLVENTNLLGSNVSPYQRPSISDDTTYNDSIWITNYPRNYALPTSLDPVYPAPYPINLNGSQNKLRACWVLAYVIGETPNREWLIYGHATGPNPDGTSRSMTALEDVEVVLPNYATVTLPELPVEGAFYYIKEA
jgi:hypothetical protein